MGHAPHDSFTVGHAPHDRFPEGHAPHDDVPACHALYGLRVSQPSDSKQVDVQLSRSRRQLTG